MSCGFRLFNLLLGRWPLSVISVFLWHLPHLSSCREVFFPFLDFPFLIHIFVLKRFNWLWTINFSKQCVVGKTSEDVSSILSLSGSLPHSSEKASAIFTGACAWGVKFLTQEIFVFAVPTFLWAYEFWTLVLFYLFLLSVFSHEFQVSWFDC